MWQDNNISIMAQPTDPALVLAIAVVAFTFAYISETETNFNKLAGATVQVVSLHVYEE